MGREVAADVTSATFLSAWLTWTSVPEPAMPWLISVARGHMRNYLRSQRRQMGVQRRLELLDQSTYRGDDTAVTAEQRIAALSALASMPNADREALLLVTWEGLSTDQASKVLRCRPAALRTRLHRARKRLDTALAADAPNHARSPR